MRQIFSQIKTGYITLEKEHKLFHLKRVRVHTIERKRRKMKDKGYEMFLEIVDREHESLVPDNTIPTFNIWDMRKDDNESFRIKRGK